MPTKGRMLFTHTSLFNGSTEVAPAVDVDSVAPEVDVAIAAPSHCTWLSMICYVLQLRAATQVYEVDVTVTVPLND